MTDQRNFTDDDELLLLRTAISHARQRLASWLEPEGMPADRCLDELIELMFHPALDDSAEAPAGRPLVLEMLRQAIRDSRAVLLRYCGERPDLRGEACLDALLIALDNRYLVAVGRFKDLFEVETVEEDLLRFLLIKPVSKKSSRKLH